MNSHDRTITADDRGQKCKKIEEARYRVMSTSSPKKARGEDLSFVQFILQSSGVTLVVVPFLDCSLPFLPFPHCSCNTFSTTSLQFLLSFLLVSIHLPLFPLLTSCRHPIVVSVSSSLATLLASEHDVREFCGHM